MQRGPPRLFSHTKKYRLTVNVRAIVIEREVEAKHSSTKSCNQVCKGNAETGVKSGNKQQWQEGEVGTAYGVCAKSLRNQSINQSTNVRIVKPSNPISKEPAFASYDVRSSVRQMRQSANQFVIIAHVRAYFTPHPSPRQQCQKSPRATSPVDIRLLSLPLGMTMQPRLRTSFL